MSDGRIRSLRSHVVYANPWMSVREDGVEFPNGTTGIYGVVDKADFAVVLPREKNGFWLVDQFRYPVERRGWEFPLGAWPEGASGTLEELALAELAEETGLRAGRLRCIGTLNTAPGVQSNAFTVFLADELVPGTPHREITESDMTCEWRSDDDLRAMITRGEFADAQSVAAFCLFLLQ